MYGIRLCRKNWQEKKIRSEKLSEFIRECEQIQKDEIPQYQNRERVLQEKQEKFVEAQSRYKKSNTERIEAEEILESCRAGILAERLIEGRKCPVCGSLHHPEPARLPDKSVSEGEVKSLRLAEEKMQGQKELALKDAEAEKAALEQPGETAADEYTGLHKNVRQKRKSGTGRRNVRSVFCVAEYLCGSREQKSEQCAENKNLWRKNVSFWCRQSRNWSSAVACGWMKSVR